MDILQSYFLAEKRESLLFMAMAVLALLVSTALALRAPGWRGAIAPILIIGVIQGVVGASVYFRTDAQVATLKVQLAENPAPSRQAEVARMEIVMRNFRLYKAIELGVMGLGLALFWAGRNSQNLLAAAWGCLVQGGVMLLLDLFAEARGIEYIKWLQELK